MIAARVPCLGIGVLLLCVSAAFGDGCYFPEQAVRKIPDIPAQRAVLSWKDGVETLVISSALKSEAQKLGWIIPLPAVPQTIEKETPGGLKTLGLCIQPEITHDLYPAIKAAVVSALIANLIMGTFLFKRKRVVDVIIVVLLLVVFYSLLLSASAGAGGSIKATKMRVEKSVAVGAYQISILRPKKLGDLNAWLGENGFSTLPAAADAVVDDYLAKGWVFAAIRLTRGESGANAPHPIRLVFSAKQAVYPLRLTALARGNTQFEVFAIGRDTASCDLLKEEFCDRFTKLSPGTWALYVPDRYEPGDSCQGNSSRCRIGHSAICSLMWNDCVLTKFSGTISAAEMTKDIDFQWRPFHAYRQHFYTMQGARDVAVIVFVSLLGGWVFVSMIVFSKRITQAGGGRWYFGKAILPAIVVSAIVAGIVYAGLPRLAASEVAVGSWRQWSRFPLSLQSRIESLLEDHADILRGTEQEIAAGLLRNLTEAGSDYAENALTRNRLQIEDSPGNFTVVKRDKKIVIRVYDSDGRVLLIERTIPGQPDKRAGESRGVKVGKGVNE
jgi:hypothetical protein